MGHRQVTAFVDDVINMKALVNPAFPAIQSLATTAPEIVCNLTIHFWCRDGACVNATVRCDGYLDCLDESDEELCAEIPVKRKLTPLEVAAIVLGCIVGTVIVCCLLGTIIDCFMHVYKYWCSCLHKAYQCPSEMIALRTQNHNPNDPTVLVVRAIPPSYSTILVSCEPSSQVARCRENETQNADASQTVAPAIIATTDLASPNSPINSHTAQETLVELVQKLNDSATNTDELICMKDMSTQTSRDSGTGDSINSTSSYNAQRPSTLMRGISRSASCIFRMRMPPSYSSIFTNEHITQTTDIENQSHQVFHNEALVSNDQLQYVYLRPIANVHAQTTNVEVHAQSTPTELTNIPLVDADDDMEMDRFDDDRSTGLVLQNGYFEQTKT